MPFLPPNQQCQSTEGTIQHIIPLIISPLIMYGLESPMVKFWKGVKGTLAWSDSTVSRNQTHNTGRHEQWCIEGYTRIYGVYQPPGFFWQRILTSVIINKQGTFRPFATPLCIYPPPFLTIHHWAWGYQNHSTQVHVAAGLPAGC